MRSRPATAPTVTEAPGGRNILQPYPGYRPSAEIGIDLVDIVPVRMVRSRAASAGASLDADPDSHIDA